jgi:hypothetical protein
MDLYLVKSNYRYPCLGILIDRISIILDLDCGSAADATQANSTSDSPSEAMGH